MRSDPQAPWDGKVATWSEIAGLCCGVDFHAEAAVGGAYSVSSRVWDRLRIMTATGNEGMMRQEYHGRSGPMFKVPGAILRVEPAWPLHVEPCPLGPTFGENAGYPAPLLRMLGGASGRSASVMEKGQSQGQGTRKLCGGWIPGWRCVMGFWVLPVEV